MLNEDGKIIDDTIVMHMGEHHYWVSTLYAPQFIKWRMRTAMLLTYYPIETLRMTCDVLGAGPNSVKMMNALLKSPSTI